MMYPPFSWQTFLGQKTLQIQQDFSLWELFFNTYPVKQCIELGTGAGGFSLYLALQCYQRSVEFWTFDNQNWIDFNTRVSRALNLESRFVCKDIFKDGREEVVSRFALNPLVLFCDNGDKPREVREFGPLLHPGDFLAVHDWETEFKPGDMILNVRPVLEEQAEKLQSMTRWFVVI